MIEGWERWVAYFSEQERIKVIITGSNASMLSPELGTMLTGRHRSVELYPFSFAELARTLQDASELLESSEGRAQLRGLHSTYLEFGGFPRAWLNRDVTITGQYFSDILSRDVVTRKRLRSSGPITTLASTIMTDITAPMNKARLAKLCGLKAAETVSRYLQFLEESYLLFEVRKFSFSRREQLRNPGKPYAIDTALAVQSGFTFFDKTGPLFENQVFLELKRRGITPYYWRSSQDYEIDFIIANHKQLQTAVQVSVSLANKDTQEREVRALLKAKEELGIADLLIITLDEERLIEQQGSVIKCVPFYKWAIDAR